MTHGCHPECDRLECNCEIDTLSLAGWNGDKPSLADLSRSIVGIDHHVLVLSALHDLGNL